MEQLTQCPCTQALFDAEYLSFCDNIFKPPMPVAWTPEAYALLQPGSMEGQLGALRRVCFGELGFVEQLDALDDEKRLM